MGLSLGRMRRVPPFTDEDAKAQRGWVTVPRSQSTQDAEPRPGSRLQMPNCLANDFSQPARHLARPLRNGHTDTIYLQGICGAT